VKGEGWVNAEDLQLGDDIRNADGSTGEVEAVEMEETSQEMYNLTVDEAHTFFVGDGQWLVHNAGICPPSSGIHLELQNAVTWASQQTDTFIAARSRPWGAYLFDNTLPFKPQGAKTLSKYSYGIRKVIVNGEEMMVVSDLDIGWVWRNGIMLPDTSITPNLFENAWSTNPNTVGDWINYYYGGPVVQHGAQVNFRGEAAKGTWNTWQQSVYIFGPNGYLGSGNLARTYGANLFPPIILP
jgi:hypothetical protein